MLEIYGKVAYVFGDNINTDIIQPPRYFSLDREKNKIGCFKGVTDISFPKLERNDIIAAGKNFGCGSSRETVVYSLIDTGISVVIAESFGRIFFRNCINNGLPAITISNASDITTGDKLYINFYENKIEINNRNKSVDFILNEKLKTIIKNGGLISKLNYEL